MRGLSVGQGAAWRRAICLVGIGFLAGVVNGLLGAGGGILVVWAMAYALRGKPYDVRDCYANALCVMLPISALSCVRYAMRGHLVTDGMGRYVIPAVLGGFVGGLLLGRLRVGALKRLFAALVIYSGLILILR